MLTVVLLSIYSSLYTLDEKGQSHLREKTRAKPTPSPSTEILFDKYALSIY